MVRSLSGRATRDADEGFGSLVDLLDAAVPDPTVSGAALSVWIDGKPVVEAQVGVADPETGAPWVDDTLSVTFSCTKGVGSALVAILVQRGLVSFDDPLESVWPEFAHQGKGTVSIGDALAHRAGVPVLRHDLTLSQMLDGRSFAEAVADERPFWEPGSDHQYHALIHGVFTEQVVQRITGKTLPEFLEEEALDLLDADYWIGLPDSEAGRMARLIPEPVVGSRGTDPVRDGEAAELVRLDSRPHMYGGINLQSFADEQEMRRGSFAGYGGIGTASGLARFWSSCVVPTRGLRLLDDATVELLSAPRSVGRPFLGGPPPYQHWGAGVMIPSPFQRYLSPGSFGHDGAGGQVAFADTQARVGFAFLTNQMGSTARGNSIVRELAALLE